MKRLIVASIGMLALGLTTASAADLRVRPVKGPPPPPPPIYYFNWTGCYIGGHIGGLWVNREFVNRTLDGPFFDRADHDVSGWLGGVQGGCDYQFAGGWVIGIQGDFAGTDADGSHVSLLFPDFTFHSKVKSLASVTGRIGYAWDRFLGYVKGGGAWERDEFSFTNGVVVGTVSNTRSGWTIGIGAEYAFANYLTGFIEYNFYDFGSRDLSFVGTTPFVFGIDETKSVVKAGLNFRFGGWGGPARY
jgi:outer membrane immunogenic protein